MKNLNLLNLTKEAEAKVLRLLSGEMNPEDFYSVRKWVSKCYNKPPKDEMIMEAFNEILEGYGIEPIEGEWRNGYWCNIVATYVNLGETYTYTIIHHRDKGFIVSSWGDVAENEILNQ